jgi:hypothetical protein
VVNLISLLLFIVFILFSCISIGDMILVGCIGMGDIIWSVVMASEILMSTTPSGFG